MHPYSPAGSRTDMSDDTHISQDPPPITYEDLANFGIEPRLIPFFISIILQAERSPDDSTPLTLAEAECLIEILDKAVSSATANPSSRNRCFRILNKVSQAYGVLPKSYFPTGVTFSDTIPLVSGSFADVWKGQQGGKQVCIKVFRTQTASKPEKIKRRFYREIVRWKHLSHPNVLPFLGVFEPSLQFSIISPWLPNGNIIDFIRKNRRANRLRLLTQAACGLEYLHSKSIVHSGIAPGNILINEDGDARLGDFGVTGIITDPTVVERDSMTTSKPGDTRYMAPELLDPHQFGFKQSNPSKESDVFSFAMTAYEVLSGDLPYGVRLDSVTAFNIVSGNRPPRPRNSTADLWLSDPIWETIMRCWNQKPRFRLSTHRLHRGFAESQLEHEEDTPVTGRRRAAADDRCHNRPPSPPVDPHPPSGLQPPVELPCRIPKPPGDDPPAVNWFKGIMAKVGIHRRAPRGPAASSRRNSSPFLTSRATPVMANV